MKAINYIKYQIAIEVTDRIALKSYECGNYTCDNEKCLKRL